MSRATLSLFLALSACSITENDSTESTGTTAEPTSTTDIDPTEVDPGTSSTSSTSDTTGTGAADCGFDPARSFDRAGAIWQLISDDGETCVLLERRDDSDPDVIYKAVPYTLLAFKVGHAGALADFTDPDKLSWESTHHNWLDVAEAWDATVRYRLADRFGQDFLDTFDLSAIDEQSKASLWGPVTVRPYAP